MKCPCCGSECAEVSAKDLIAANLTRTEQLVLSELIHVFPRWTEKWSIIENVWGVDASDKVENNLCAVLSGIRRKLKPFGWTIPNAREQARYRLERIV